MSDALSDIRKTEMNRPKYSQVEYDRALNRATKAEQRIADVIAELEERTKLLENARGRNMNLSGGNLSISLYRDIISLLKNGVKQ